MPHEVARLRRLSENRIRPRIRSPPFLIVEDANRIGRALLIALELLLLSAIIILPRLANHDDVFVNGNIYFTDADCYARMTRVQKCIAHPGLIIRHHDFENYPEGTTPHTTAPLDYFIVGLAKLLGPFTNQPVDLAGALISPLLGLIGAWFLWWWTRLMKLKFGGLGLVLYAVSPILVHGTELGRPDHQSFLIVLILIAFCAEWTLAVTPSRAWGIVSGCAWGLALWVSLYEPGLLFALLFLPALLVRRGRNRVLSSIRIPGWISLVVILAIALLMERRIPSARSLVEGGFVRHWMHVIGELRPVPLRSATWFNWAGYMILLVPFVSVFLREEWWEKTEEAFFELSLLILLGITFGLTLWQARWAYFFLSIFVLLLPWLFQSPAFAGWSGSRLFFHFGRWLGIGMIGFGLTRMNRRVWPNNSRSVRTCASSPRPCDPRKSRRSWPPGGFPHRFRIGPDNRR